MLGIYVFLIMATVSVGALDLLMTLCPATQMIYLIKFLIFNILGADFLTSKNNDI